MSEKIAVLCGGRSSERSVSLASGKAVKEGLCQAGIAAVAVDPITFPLCDLKADGYQKVFIALHGRGGEDGSVQGVLESLALPYTGSGILASALALDKWRSKLVWHALGLPVVPYVVVQRGEMTHKRCDSIVAQLGLPLVVKPHCEGSSIGVHKVMQREALPAALEDAWCYSETLIVEQWIAGREFTVSILGLQPLPAIRIQAAGQYYDYQAKYCSEGAVYSIPCGLEVAQEEALQALALSAYQAIGCRGWGRVDLMVDGRGQFYLLEINTVPGMTPRSLVPMAARQVGLTFPQLVTKILQLAT